MADWTTSAFMFGNMLGASALTRISDRYVFISRERKNVANFRFYGQQVFISDQSNIGAANSESRTFLCAMFRLI